MIDARITKKITAACKHELPVVVSCLECVQSELRTWETRIRDDYKHTIADEWRFMEEQVKSAREQTANLQDTNDRLGRIVAKLESENRRLKEEAKVSKTLIDSLSVQSHAEQASKQKYPALVEEAE